METSGRLSGKVAFVTGAAQGQGEAEARLFAEHGARVVVADIQGALAAEVAGSIGESATAMALDVSDEEQWAEAIATTERIWGHVDVLVNNAAVAGLAPLLTATADQYREIWKVNEFGVFLGMQAAARSMRAGGRGGSIVNISSIDGLFGQALLGPYVASKFAVRGLTKVGALELAPFGIRVNSIHPGWVDTPMTRNSPEMHAAALEHIAGKPIPRMGTPREVAYLALYLASDESSFTTGAEHVIDGGYLCGEWPPLTREMYGSLIGDTAAG